MAPRIPEVTLLEEVGRGHSCVVFRGLHRGNPCTIKLPSDRPPPSATLQRAFAQDVLRLARLGNHGLPRVWQFDSDGEIPYAILELPEGEPFVRVFGLARSESEQIRLALKLAACIERLHDAGFVHGALTAENVRVTDDGARIVLVDAGSVTRLGPFDESADLRAFGAILMECVSAQPRSPRSLAGSSALQRIAEELATGARPVLAPVVAELAAHAGLAHERPASYPPPNLESVGSGGHRRDSRRARSELSQLLRVWQHAEEAGGKVVEVVGAAGSGKSRLLAAFASELAERDAQVLSVQCRDSDWAPFSTLRRLLEAHVAGLAALPPARRTQLERRLREAAGPIGATIGVLSPHLAELFRGAGSPISSVDAQTVFAAGMADFLARYVEAEGRSVFVVDDLHWSDASSRMVLARVAARSCGRGHVFVCSAREDVDSRALLDRFNATLAPERIERLSLGPLGKADAANLIAAYLGLESQPPRELVQLLGRLSDGTPLNLLELLELALEGGHLRPRAGVWRLDAVPVQRMRLPAPSLTLVERRLAQLEAPALELLRIAAVLRGDLELRLLAGTSGLRLEAARNALTTAVQARLLDVDAQGHYFFVHDSIWEALVRPVSELQRRAIRQRAADLSFEAGGDGADYEYRLARLYAAGVIEQNPRRTFEVTWRAARRALEACDDALARTLLSAAERAAARIEDLEPGPEFFLALAETSFRTGAHRESLDHFARALARSEPGFPRASVLGRIAWVYHFESNALLARENLEAALAECGRTMPANDSVALALAASRGLLGVVGLPARALAPEQAAVLCALYAQSLRVSVDGGHPLRGVSSALLMASAAKSLPPGRLVVQSELFMAFCFAVSGADKLADGRFARAETMARELADPIAQTLCHQIAHVIAGWRGDLVECERQAHLCVDERGHWMDLGELCLVCFGMTIIELARGRPLVALEWAERAIERVRPHGRAPGVFSLITEAAYATLGALGRDTDAARLERTLRFVECSEPRGVSFFALLSYRSRAQRLIERGELGADFEALVEAFDRLGQNPKHVHLGLVLYYVHVAHARVQQCLRAGGSERAALLPKLKRALADLRAATRVEGLISHTSVVEAAYQWFCGSNGEAEASLTRAESLARKHGVPWVSFEVARLRAHMLRAAGDRDGALDHAKVAALWARNHTQVGRLRVIEEEFGLPSSIQASRREADAVHARRHLDTLLRIGRANSRELGPNRQAGLILDELLDALGAARAFLFMRAEGSEALVLCAARGRGGKDLEPSAVYDQGLVDQVYTTGQPHPADAKSEGGRADDTCIVVALVLRERSVGVLYLDRADDEAGFRPEDFALLQALANQVPVALELGRALRERDRLQQNLRQGQKMEAIGRLAGGIAHDFNNVLATIQFAADGLATLIAVEHDGREELDDIRDAARRGTDLTRQLVTFSRGKAVLPRRIVLGDVVRDLVPMIRRLIRPEIELAVEIDDEPLPTMADPTDIERVLLNLCQNASAAILDRGTISIRVERATVDDTLPIAAEPRDRGGYALLSVTDTGTGMNEETRQRLFEPFFTTKPGGTGLGLANVYAIVQRCLGYVDVTSELELGSSFRIYLRLDDDEVAALDVEGADVLDRGTILVVDDDETIRRGLLRTLKRNGYVVLTAADGETALRVVDAYDGLIDLAIADVHLPGMNGAELIAALLHRDPDIKALVISGDAPAELIGAGLVTEGTPFLHKPFEETALLAHVTALLQGPPELRPEQPSH